MPKEHSTQKGGRPLVLSADRFTERSEIDGTESYFEGVRVVLELPQNFDLEKHSRTVLGSIKDAMNLFTREADAE